MDTKQLVINGINKAADIIKSTMGANGQLVALKNNGQLQFTKDGVTVARHIDFEDYYEKIGCEIVVNAANKTVEMVGDGTTCTSVMVQAFLNQFNKLSVIYDNNQLTAALDTFVKDITTKLEEKSFKVEDTEKVKQIATISSNSEELGSLIKEIYDVVGLNSLISLEKSDNYKTTYEVIKGIEFETGLVHPEFKTNDTNCTYTDANILISEDPCNNFLKFEKQFKFCLESEQPIVLISPSFSPDFIRTCIMNKQRNGLQVCLVKSPGFGNGVNKNHDDIRAFLSKKDTVEKVVVTEQSFTLYNTDTPFLNKRIDKLRKLHEAAENKYDEQDYYLRMHKLQGNTAIVYAGGITEQNMQEEYDRLEDALHAVKSAIRGGYTVGGGYGFIELITNENSIFSDILKSPVYTIINNSHSNPEIILSQCNKEKQYNVKTKKFENFLETGIIDPTEVLINSLVNAWAAVKLFINTSNILINVKNKS
jgi:chaperonin GroEL